MKITSAVVALLFTLVSALPAESATALSERAPDVAKAVGPPQWGNKVGNTRCYLRADLDKTSQPALFDFAIDWNYDRQFYEDIFSQLLPYGNLSPYLTALAVYTDSWGQFPAVKELITGPRHFAKFDGMQVRCYRVDSIDDLVVSHSNKYGTWRWVIAAIYYTDHGQLTFDVDFEKTEVYGSQ
ncbi:uncharacterized protein L969DRAFT_49966 [Mixia osmundae IAM 14324]|uniref:SnoaL-like domain-containing protein n=1 Tax=Mixia osmundae (strain CBS 9802 / IAM 14324 / JCM 22182 / KY 12970) TaxID=764103 RepID=G7E737_MIXOS|nr:uncharacterized protein L969DRAFT_49966 [Mixia osmundae IAM 14324]KEI38970.1 hypothetical protein L969DRAFT_49966 [Mixia osmundae IAM 14324]GAA98647.1 hypothetical protein E5Q_05334 [Mixia osmundae IAM 14324]